MLTVLKVEGVPPTASEDELREVFSPLGCILRIYRSGEGAPEPGGDEVYMVEMARQEEAQKVLDAYGNSLKISIVR